jgi:hypothetical protein
MLSLGIAGKQSLWKALRIASNEDHRLREYDFDLLLRRAEDQFELVEQERLRLVPRVFVVNSESHAKR